MMSVAQPFLEDQMHPTVIIGAYRQAMDDMLEILRDQISVPVDVDNREEMLKIVYAFPFLYILLILLFLKKLYSFMHTISTQVICVHGKQP